MEPQLLQEAEAQEAAMIKCAKRAWASLNRGYDLIDFYWSDAHAVVGVGYPPRASAEYHHAFLFERSNWKGAVCDHLRAVGKAPGHTTLSWRGTSFTNRRALVATFELGEFCFPKPY